MSGPLVAGALTPGDDRQTVAAHPISCDDVRRCPPPGSCRGTGVRQGKRGKEIAVKGTIRLRGLNGAVKGQRWEAPDLRIGRLSTLEVVLDDNSVSRYHAEIRMTEHG